jgi:hypothetical protein
VRTGNYGKGLLKRGDVLLCNAHSGDCFQNYTIVEGEHQGRSFGSYGVGDSTKLEGTE